MTAGFWDWSVATYAKDRLAAELLDMQDRFGLSVNLLLWCAWCARGHAEIPELELRRAADLCARWGREVSEPLRAARRALKHPPPEADAASAARLRKSVADAELAAEEIEQRMLEALARERLPALAAPGDATGRARRNLARYVSLAGAQRLPGFSTLPLDRLAMQAGPDDSPEAATTRETEK